MQRTRHIASLLQVWIALLVFSIALPAQEREPLEVFQARREALRQKLTDGLIVLFGHTDDSGPDSLLPFRQENSFYYLTGFNHPGAVLLLAPPVEDRRSRFRDESLRLPREILFLPAHDSVHEHWTGPKPNPANPATAAQTGFAVVKDVKELESELRRYARGYPNVYTLLPGTHSEETESSFARDNVERLRTIVPRLAIKEARAALGALRQIKSEGELALIRKATECSLDAHLAAMRETRPGVYEYEVAALMQYTFANAGCTRPAYGPIVGSGPRSTILHYNRNTEQMQTGDLVVLDVGGEYAHYAADITRTLPVSGRFTPRQREIYEIVLGAQKAAIAAVKPGMGLSRRDANSLFQIAFDYINTHGKDLHGQPLGKYFTHGLGHHIGLYVHDLFAPGALLEPGMVLTIEPGIYIPEENIGVRIEDMLLVTETGYVLLSERLPREVDEIEQLMQSAMQSAPGR
jgi:Xaa-Pro aminopeptidase